MITDYFHRSPRWKLVAAGALLPLTLVGFPEAAGQSRRMPALSEVFQATSLGPIDVAASPDGKTVYVACADSRQVVAVDS